MGEGKEMLGAASPYTLSRLRGEGEGWRGFWRGTRAWRFGCYGLFNCQRTRKGERSDGVMEWWRCVLRAAWWVMLIRIGLPQGWPVGFYLD
jgi:hypothetical protein